MTTTLHKWRVFCTTENSYQYKWLESTAATPSTCPNNAAHSINTLLTSIVDTLDTNTVSISQELTPTGGHYRFDSFAFDALPDSTTLHSFSYPFNISILEGSFVSAAENKGDTWTWVVAENTTIGALTANVSVSDTTINVSPTVVSYIAVGYHMNLFDGVNTSDLGRVISIDKVNNQVVVETGSTHSFLAATPTYVRMSIYFMKDVEFGNPWVYEYGSSKIKSSPLPVGTTVKVYYTNQHATDTKRIVVNIEMLY